MSILAIEYPNKYYDANEWIEGVVRLSVGPNQRVPSQITVLIKGTAETHTSRTRITGTWTSTYYDSFTNTLQTTTTATYTTDYYNTYERLCFNARFFTTPTEWTLPVDYRLPFRLQVPAKLCQTWESESGKLEYIIKAKIENNGQEVSRWETALKVNLLVDYSYMKQTTQRSVKQVEHFWFYTWGDVQLTATVPKQSYRRNEIIPVTLHLDNKFRNTNFLVRVVLKRTTYFYRSHLSSSSFTHEELENYELELGDYHKINVHSRSDKMFVEQNGSKTWIHNVQVPSGAFFTVAHRDSHLIQIDYELKICIAHPCKLPRVCNCCRGCFETIYRAIFSEHPVSIPIYIGTVQTENDPSMEIDSKTLNVPRPNPRLKCLAFYIFIAVILVITAIIVWAMATHFTSDSDNDTDDY